MTNELRLFKIDNMIGWDQEQFSDRWMNKGGCGAVTACDCCIYFAREFGMTQLYPFDCEDLTREDYISFSKIMKPYLSPRISGINTLEIFIDGLKEYLDDAGCSELSMSALYSDCEYDKYKSAVKAQLDKKLPVPYLNLKHKNPVFDDFVWHWFWLAGYAEAEDIFMIKIISYGEYKWFDLRELWDSGYSAKGGIVLFDIK